MENSNRAGKARKVPTYLRVFMAFLLIAALAAVPVFALGCGGEKKVEDDTTKDDSGEPVEVGKDDGDDTTDNGGEVVVLDEMYTNSRFGFTIDCPSSWSAVEGANQDGATISSPENDDWEVRAYASHDVFGEQLESVLDSLASGKEGVKRDPSNLQKGSDPGVEWVYDEWTYEGPDGTQMKELVNVIRMTEIVYVADAIYPVADEGKIGATMKAIVENLVVST